MTGQTLMKITIEMRDAYNNYVHTLAEELFQSRKYIPSEDVDPSHFELQEMARRRLAESLKAFPAPIQESQSEEKTYTQSEFDKKFDDWSNMYKACDPRLEEHDTAMGEVWAKFIMDWQPGQINSVLGEALQNKFKSLKAL